MSTDHATTAFIESELRPERSWRWKWLLVAVVAFVVAVVGAISWASLHPDQSFPGNYGVGVERRVGEPVWTTLVHAGRPGAEQITITSLEPHIESNSADAAVDYLICELDPQVLDAEGVGGFGYGLHARDVATYCRNTRPAAGGTFRLRSQPAEELLVGVMPTRPGRTVISGHRMSFRVGWQRGTEDLAVEVDLVALRRSD